MIETFTVLCDFCNICKLTVNVLLFALQEATNSHNNIPE